jgi:hypothetical protein
LTTRFFAAAEVVPWDAAVVPGIVVAGVVDVVGEDDPLEDMDPQAARASVAAARNGARRVRVVVLIEMAQPLVSACACRCL